MEEHWKKFARAGRNTRFLVGLSGVLAGLRLAWEDSMTIPDGGCARAKVLMAATTSALVMWAMASPAAADDVRWRTVVGIV